MSKAAEKSRRFEYKDEKSSKFWEISVAGNGFTVRYGKIGTDGQTQTKEFADAATAVKQAQKLIAEKTGKGYQEVGAGGTASDSPPIAITESKPAKTSKTSEENQRRPSLPKPNPPIRRSPNLTLYQSGKGLSSLMYSSSRT